MVKTKIMATLGPASSTPQVLRKMIDNGIDGVRLNFSHGTHKEHIARLTTVRSLNKKMHRAIKIMQDLEGYRLRVGKVAPGTILKKNSIFYLFQDEIEGSEKEASFDYHGPLKDIKNGSLVYIDDGKILLKVIQREKKKLRTKVLVAGELKTRKGINIIGAKLTFDALTEKDKRDVQVAIKYRLDYVAQSFVRSAQDLKVLKEIILPEHQSVQIFAKVESKEALENIDEIIDEADGIIVARGDLGICLPIYKVPVFQKELIKKCLLKHKPVIVATQLLDSMTEEKLPTRAEVSDVANAIFDGATHLLLSGETAIGRHPHKVIEMMSKIIKNSESYQDKLSSLLQ